MQEVDADAIQVGVELRESVEPGFDSAPVVIARPIFADVLHVLEGNPLRRISNGLPCVFIDEARRPFEEDIDRVLVDIELAKRLQRVVAAALHLDGKLIAPAPRQPYSSLRRPEIAVLADEKGLEPLRGPVGLLV